jgi:hypothetical protein
VAFLFYFNIFTRVIFKNILVKKVLLFGSIFSAILVASCNKCETCSHTFKLGGVDSTISYPQTCGNKKTIDTYEKGVSADAAVNGATVTCVDDTKK